MSENSGIICNCQAVVGGVSSTSPEGFSQVICKEHWFEREVERRAGASREQMLVYIKEYDDIINDAVAAHTLADWLRRILVEESK